MHGSMNGLGLLPAKRKDGSSLLVAFQIKTYGGIGRAIGSGFNP